MSTHDYTCTLDTLKGSKRYSLLFWATSSHLQADDIGVCLKSVCSPQTPKIGQSSKNPYVTHRFEGNKSLFCETH